MGKKKKKDLSSKTTQNSFTPGVGISSHGHLFTRAFIFSTGTDEDVNKPRLELPLHLCTNLYLILAVFCCVGFWVAAIHWRSEGRTEAFLFPWPCRKFMTKGGVGFNGGSQQHDFFSPENKREGQLALALHTERKQCKRTPVTTEAGCSYLHCSVIYSSWQREKRRTALWL